MKKWWKQIKWWMWVLLAVVVGFLFWMVSPFIFSKDSHTKPIQPTLPKAVQEKLDTAHEEALEAKVEARVEAEADKEKLEEIRSVDNGKERRKQLAEFLRNL